jgi:hypothetical protein
MEEHGGENTELTPEQEVAAQKILERVEETKKGTMRCLICNEDTHDRGLVFTHHPPAIPIIIGLCFPCKNLPAYEEEVQRCIREYLRSVGREDLL